MYSTVQNDLSTQVNCSYLSCLYIQNEFLTQACKVCDVKEQSKQELDKMWYSVFSCCQQGVNKVMV